MHVCPPKTLNSGWANSKVGGAKFQKRGAAAPIPFLPTFFRKRADAPARQCNCAFPTSFRNLQGISYIFKGPIPNHHRDIDISTNSLPQLVQAAPEDLVTYPMVTAEIGLPDAVYCQCPGPKYNKISGAIFIKDYSIGIFIDLSQAFDTINYTIPHSQLQYYMVFVVPHCFGLKTTLLLNSAVVVMRRR